MQVMTDSAKRVPEHTAMDVNLAIADRTKRSVAWFDDHREQIPRRLAELDREWDVERMLAMGSSCLSLAGLALARAASRRWLWLPLAVQSFYLQHTLQGWCPPLPALRRLGFRTPSEIEFERNALKALLRENAGEWPATAAVPGHNRSAAC
jgi:hypothetical protein